MYQEQEDRFYYLTLYNENYAMPADAGRRSSRRHSARAFTASKRAEKGKAQGAAVRQRPDPERSAAAQQILAEKYDVAADVWSVTSYNELRREALRVERWNRLHPDRPAQKPYIAAGAGGRRRSDRRRHRLHEGGADQIAPWLPGPHGNAGHRRLRPQRQPRIPAPALRNQRRIDRRRGAVAPRARRQVRREESAKAAFAELGVDTEKIDASKA